MGRLLTALACGAALAIAVGCGESDQEKAREVVQEFVDARTGEDFQAECDLYSESYLAELAVSDCAAFVQEQTTGAEGEEELEIVDVEVNGERATANIDVTREAEGGPVRIGLLLEEEDGDWRITGFQ
jgi:ketosteroid isomerase-like protein